MFHRDASNLMSTRNKLLSAFCFISCPFLNVFENKIESGLNYYCLHWSSVYIDDLCGLFTHKPNTNLTGNQWLTTFVLVAS